MSKSFFPLKIQYQDDESIVIVKSPNELRSGKVFKVLETEVKIIKEGKNV